MGSVLIFFRLLRRGLPEKRKTHHKKRKDIQKVQKVLIIIGKVMCNAWFLFTSSRPKRAQGDLKCAYVLPGVHPRQKVFSTKMTDTKSNVFISIDHFFEF